MRSRQSAPSGAPDNAALPYEIARLQKDFPVTLYTTPTCKAGCDSARNALNRRGIPFREVSVVDPQTTEELQKVSGGLQVPTMLVGRQVERGFEQSSFDTLLDSAGYPKEGTVPARKPAAKPVAAKPAAEPPAQAKRGRYDLGGLGGTAFTPIVNQPEAAILGMSRSRIEPVWQEGQFVPRLMLPLSLSYDHRIVDGADGIRFLRYIVDRLEHPFLLAL